MINDVVLPFDKIQNAEILNSLCLRETMFQLKNPAPPAGL